MKNNKLIMNEFSQNNTFSKLSSNRNFIEAQKTHHRF